MSKSNDFQRPFEAHCGLLRNASRAHSAAVSCGFDVGGGGGYSWLNAAPRRTPGSGRFARLLFSVFAAFAALPVLSAPVPLEKIEAIAGGIASSVEVSYASGAAIKAPREVMASDVQVAAVTSTNSDDTAFYVINRGSAGGFVVMSADDRLDPVLVIAPTGGDFDATPGTPLYDLLCGDVRMRVEEAETTGAEQSAGWAQLLDVNAPALAPEVFDGLPSIPDVRVDKIVQSVWNQLTHDNSWSGKKVYNYYTPNNYYCGCVATAGAQIMRFWKYPKGSVAKVTRKCYVSGTAKEYETIGGVYSWSDMPLNPNYSGLTETQQQAIGKVCYDMGVAVYMNWGSGGSGAPQICLVDAFKSVFGYKNAMGYYADSGSLSASVVRNAMLANFDAGYPVGISIYGPSDGHSIVADGYGYSGSTLYVHLNMGWGGNSDLWYNLPDIGTQHSFNTVNGIVYNIFPEETGVDLLTGRVIASDGSAIAGATVRAYSGGNVAGTATTSSTGVYALRLPGGVSYSVVASAPGMETATSEVYLEKSVTLVTVGRGSYYPGTATIGNSWGNDFELAIAAEPDVPAVPAGVSAWDGTSTEKVRVTWKASSGATYYKVYRASSDSSNNADCIAASVTSLYYDDTDVDVGTVYYYWVKAGNSVGESDFSASDSGWKGYALPDAPTNVSASQGTSTAGVVVSWEAVDDAMSYEVWRAESSSSASASRIADGITVATYTDTTAAVGTTYWYWVKAVGRGGTSDWSNSAEGYRKMAAPSAPAGVSASDGLSSTEIVVSWNAVATADSYSVYRGTASSSSAATEIASGLTVTSYSDSVAVSGTTYYYWVRAKNAGGWSAFSSSDTGYLARITGPATVSASDGTFADYVRVTWSASQNATSYNVWRGTVNAYSQAQKIASPTTTAYNDSSATPGMRYYYWVQAETSAGTSAFSASDSGYRPLSVPTGVAASTGHEDGVRVTWAAVTGATSYQIGRGAEGASAPSDTNIGTSTSLSYTDSTAVPGVTYTYFVCAVTSVCTSDWSASASGSRLVPTPTGLTASDGTYTDRILVTWPTLAGATEYELMRSDEDDITLAETIKTTSSTSFSDTTAEYGLTYYYFLRAKFAAGTSNWSASEPGYRAFPAPTGVSATDGTNQSRITITWNAIEGATLYQIWRYSDSTGRNELIGTSTSNSYNDSKNVSIGILYSYRVKAVFPTGTSKLSSPDSGYLQPSSPTPVASDGTSTSQITLTWPKVQGSILGYLVYRSTTSSAPASDSQPLASTDQPNFTDTTASKGTLYYYWVCVSTENCGQSPFGSSDTGYIALPEVKGVAATDGIYSDKVVVSWSAVSGASSYEVWRGTSDDKTAASRVARNITTTRYEDTDVTPGLRAWYWVKAYDVGPGFWSNPSDSGWRKLSAPTDITATTNQTDGIKVSWKGSTSGVSFEIKRGMTDDFNSAEVVATVSDKSNYTDNTTVPGYRYYYWVRSYSELDQNAAWSNMAEGFRAVSPPASLAATDGTSLEAVTVTWPAATSAKRYEIYRNTTTKTDTAELIGTTNKLVWVDATVQAGVTYYYWLKSVSALDTSAFSGRDSGYVSTPPPADVTASDGYATNYVHVSWAEADGAVSYAVWRAETNDVASASQLAAGVTALEYDDKSAVPGKYYWYWVRPVSVAGQGVFAGPDRGYAALSAPADVAATTNNAANVTISWKRTNGAAAYEVFRAESDNVEEATNSVLATVTSLSYADTNAFPAVRYWYWVRATAEADVSPLGGPADGYRILSVPAAVSASDGISDEYIFVSWSASAGASGYEIWRAENSTRTTDATRIDTVGDVTNYVDTAASPGISYTYWLKAVSEVYTTGFSSNDKGWRSLAAPAQVLASDGTTSQGVVVEWTGVDSALKYEVWRFTGDEATTNGASRIYTTPDASTFTYTDTNAKAGEMNWYWVRSVGAAGTGVFGTPDSGYRAVSAPTNLRATDGSSYDYVRVTWTAAAGAESYEICRVPTNETYEATNEYFSVTGATFDDTNAVPGIVYAYSLRTKSPLSTSEFTNPDEGWRKFRAATGLQASDGSSLDSVDLSWTAPEGAVKFSVSRSVSSSVASAVKIATVEGTSYSDESALHGVKYFYWVNASADVEGETGTANDGWRALLTPGNIVATEGDSTSHVRITWTESPDATSYEVLRGPTEDAGSMTLLKTLSAPLELAYEDTNGTPGSNYWYTVRACGTGGKSDPGIPHSGYRALDVSSAGVSATDGTLSGQIKVTWKAVPGATHYQVWRAESDEGKKDKWSAWISGTSFTDTKVAGGTRYWYYIKAAVDSAGSRESSFSGGDSGYTNEDGMGTKGVELGGGITWPVVDNGDGTSTTNAISFASIDGGKLSFTGIDGETGATAEVYVRVKTSLDSAQVYTVPASLEIVAPETAELDLTSVWGNRQSLFVIGISTTPGEELE